MQKKSYVDPENARNEEYRQTLLMYEEKGIDPFTKANLVAEGKKILYETPHWFVFENDHPYIGSEIHLVFVSELYAESLWDLPVEAQLDLICLRKRICNELGITGGASVARFGNNTKRNGATVTHYHEHLILPGNGKKVSTWFGSERIE